MGAGGRWCVMGGGWVANNFRYLAIIIYKSFIQTPYYMHNIGLHTMYGKLHIYFVERIDPENHGKGGREERTQTIHQEEEHPSTRKHRKTSKSLDILLERIHPL
jgi:hypothetical protein